jgi:Uma2 family endonuclease
VNGKLIVRERPGGPHETLSEYMGMVFGNYMGMMAVLTPGGSTRFQYGANSSLEPDECFFNRHMPPNNVITDVHGEKLPSIIIEINSSESYTSSDETAQVYLNNPATRVVISIKLVISHSRNQNKRGKITQMYFILYRQRDRQPGANRVNPFQVVSFGALRRHHQ